MAKINITKPTGEVEAFYVVSAFKADNQTYVILDSERVGSMGLPIIYVSKYSNKLEKINDANEWQSVKNYLKGIINGTNFEYIKIEGNILADEVYYTPLTLPQASFDLIKSRYVVDSGNNAESVVLEKKDMATISDLMNEATSTKNEEEKPSVEAIIPQTVANSNMQMNTSIPTPPIADIATPIVEPNMSEVPKDIPVTPTIPLENVKTNEKTLDGSSFDSLKETFMSACENMFDALMNKYERKLEDLEEREQALKQKEQEIDMKLKNASEHLANAEAREVVANIAHDNAKRVMDISNLMPSNPNNNN